VLDQQGNYMFRPLEAIFRLHKIQLDEKDTIHIVCAMVYLYAIAHTTCIISLSSRSILCNLKMASSGRNM